MTIPGSKITPIRGYERKKPCEGCGIPRECKTRDKYGLCRDCFDRIKAEGMLHKWAA